MKRFFGRLKLWHKISIIVVAFTLPLCCLAFFVFREYRRQIDFGLMEMRGNEYQRPLQGLLERFPQHDKLTQAYLRGDKQSRGEISAKQQEIDRAFELLEGVDKKIGALLQFTDEGLARRKREHASAPKVKQKWQDLKNRMSQLSPEAARERHVQLVADIRTMISHCGDMSQLILDPDLDSYYLMNDTLLLLPQTQDRLGTIIVEASLFGQKGPGKEQIARLAEQIALLKEADFGAIVAGTQTALNENKNLGEVASVQRNIPVVLKEYSDATEKFLAVARQLVAGEKPGVDTAAYVAAAEEARAASFRLWDVAVAELDVILMKRTDHYRGMRSQATLAAVVAVIFLFGCVVFLIRNINGLVAQVQRSGIQVNTSATEMAATSKQQQATANEIAATTAEIGATSKQIATTADDLVKTVAEVNKVAEQTAQAASEGQTSLTRMEGTIQQIMSASSAIASKLAVLNDKAGNINTVVTTITKVADQTNLLSLNAAIEAEKAGEHGRGFAVVATEIRRLADQTAVGTYDITQMVKEMQSAVAGGVMGMEKFSDEVRKGAHDVTQVASQLAQIIHQVQALTPRFERVNEGMQSQAVGARQISEALTQLSEAVQQTVESLAQSNDVIERLNEAAVGLHSGVASLN